MNQHAMWKYCIAHKWGRMYIYTEYARTIYIYINKYINIYIYIYRQIFVLSTSVGLAALAPIIYIYIYENSTVELASVGLAQARPNN